MEIVTILSLVQQFRFTWLFLVFIIAEICFLQNDKRLYELFSEGRSSQNVEDEVTAVVQVIDVDQDGEY